MENKEEELTVVVFDLNGTFYNKHSKDEFYKFILSKNPSRFHYFFQMAFYKILKKLHQLRETEFKENFFNYLDHLSPEQVEAYAEEFWEQEYPANFNKKLKARFDELKEKGIYLFCATGGLELYVKPLFRRYTVDGFAGTLVTYENGTYKVIGKACKEEEKLRRLSKQLNGRKFKIIEAYSDSKEVILNQAEKAFLLNDGNIMPYQQ